MSNLRGIKDKARQAYRDQQTQDTEGGSPCPTSFVAGFLEGYRQLESEKAVLEKKLEEAEKYKVHYDRIFAKSIVIPTEEYIKEREKLKTAVEALKEAHSLIRTIGYTPLENGGVQMNGNEWPWIPRALEVIKKAIARIEHGEKPDGILKKK